MSLFSGLLTAKSINKLEQLAERAVYIDHDEEYDEVSFDEDDYLNTVQITHHYGKEKLFGI